MTDRILGTTSHTVNQL